MIAKKIGDDDLFMKAAEIVIREQKASASFIQRHLQIGYNRASYICEDLQAAGVISAANEVAKRHVLLKDWEHFKKAVALTDKTQEVAENMGIPAEKVIEKAKEKAGIGHNSEKFPSKGEAHARLRSFIERVERLEGEKAELSEDIKEVYGEAKANGYDPKIMRKIVRMRKMDVEKRQEEDALVEVYKLAVGLD